MMPRRSGDALCACLSLPRCLPSRSPRLGQGQNKARSTSTTGPTISPRTSSRAFEKDTGIKVNYTTYDSNEIPEAKLRAGRSGYDVVVPTASPFFVRQLAANLYKPLDKARLKNLKNLDPEIMGALAQIRSGQRARHPLDVGHHGIGYNVDVRQEAHGRRAGRSVEDDLRSRDRVEVCRLRRHDARQRHRRLPGGPEVSRHSTLDSKKPDDLAKAADVEGGAALHPQVPFLGVHQRPGRRRHLPCLRSAWATSSRRAIAPPLVNDKQTIAYAIPREGSLLWIDVAAIPKDAPNADNAPRFLDFLLEPMVAAASSEAHGLRQRQPRRRRCCCRRTSRETRRSIRRPTYRAKFYTITAGNAEQMRERTRLWTTVETGR